MRQSLLKFNDIMVEHDLTVQQTYTILCMANSIDISPTAEMYQVFIQKRLLNATGVNTKVLYRGEDAPVQQELPLEVVTEPKGDKLSLLATHNLEKALVPEKERAEHVIRDIANKYFKGDIGCARYYNIFKWCFPRKSHKLFNKKYGVEYNEDSRWDSTARVARNFQKIYLKKDIGAFFWGLHMRIRDSINKELNACYMTKPNKFLSEYEQWYDMGVDMLEKKRKEQANE